MLKKGLALVTIVLFVCMSIVPSSGITIKNSVSSDPYTPSDPFPCDGETDVPIDGVVLDWSDCNPWNDVYFGKSNPPPLVAESIRDNHYDPGLMDANTTYYWKIVGKNGGVATYPGPIWNFTTGSWINHPPKPEITIERVGGGTGEGVYWIFIKLNDPDGDNIEGAFIVHDRLDFAWPINDPYHGDPPWANGTILQEQYYYGKGWHEIKVTCWDSWVDGTGYLEFTFPRSRVQSIQQPLISLFSQQINQLLQNSIASSNDELINT